MASPLKRLSVDEYFRGPETVRPMELVFGVVREPPAPKYGHQSVVTRLTVLLDRHVREGGLGEICVSPIDVVLDEAAALVVQPDILFVSKPRLGIIRDRVWGAPDLVVEVLSAGTARRDRTTKLAWYRRYGVTECWLLDSARGTLEVVGQNVGPEHRPYSGEEAILSVVLPDIRLSVSQILD